MGQTVRYFEVKRADGRVILQTADQKRADRRERENPEYTKTIVFAEAKSYR